MKSIENNNIFQLYVESVNPSQPSPEDQKKLADFFVNLIVKIENGDQEAQRILNLPQNELMQYIESSKENVQTEAFENIRSRIGGAFSGSGPATKRYEIFLNSIKKKLWELGEDIKSTNDQNNIQTYDDLIQQIQQVEPNMVPEGGKYQKKLYGAGKVASKVGKIGGSIVGAGLIASALSTIGLPAVAIGAIIGGGLKTLKNLSNTNMTPQEKLKKALMGAGLGAITGYALGELREFMSDTSMNSARAEADRIDPDEQTLRRSQELIDQGVEGVPETGVTQNTSGEIDSTVKVRVGSSLPNSERLAFTKGKMRALQQLAAHLGTDTIRGVTYDHVIDTSGDMYVTATWSQASSDTAKQIADTMSRPQ
jgi:hypothetical protein